MDQITLDWIPYVAKTGAEFERIIAGAPIDDERRLSAKEDPELLHANPGQTAGHQGFLDYRLVDLPEGGRTLYIARVAVEPFCDARYVGRALVHGALLAAQKEGAQSMFAYVENENDAAQGFFERNSFLRTDHGNGVEYATAVPLKEVLPLDEMIIVSAR